MKSFSSINQFRHVIKNLKHMGLDNIKFQGSTKLHGTNLAISLQDGLVIHTRSGELQDNHFGCIEFVKENEQILTEVLLQIKGSDERIPMLHGELVGKGINKGAGICTIEGRYFVMFNTSLNSDVREYLNTIPNTNDKLINVEDAGIFICTISMNNIQETKEYLETLTLQVEQECPFTKQVFGISGIGEGIVWKPMDSELAKNTNLWFKTKGEKHSNNANNHKPKIILSSEELETIDDLVITLLPDWRLEQFLPDELSDENYHGYLKDIFIDINKEESDLLDLDKPVRKELNRKLSQRIRSFYLSL